MKSLLLLCIILCTGWYTLAQSYAVTAISGTYTANASPTEIHPSGTDDATITGLPIGFTFEYSCSNYTTFECSTNGWIAFGTSAGAELTNNLSTTTNRPKIAPLWDDLATGTGNVNYKLTGTAPNRVLTVEWKQIEWSFSATGDVISFQVKLYETSNNIEFVYNQGPTAVSVNGASIGLALPTSGQYYSLQDVSAAPVVSTSTENTAITTKPANGQIYRFSPGTVCSGTPAAGAAVSNVASTNCSSNSISLSATGITVGCGITYQWQSSPDNATWTNIVGATSNVFSGTNMSSTYYRLVTTCSNSASSNQSSSVLVSFTGSVPVNDLPCNAILLSNGVIEVGNNSCSGNSGEPTTPSCWTSGNVNTIWYRFSATSATMTLNTINSTITGTQLQVYSGTCGSLTPLASGCAIDGFSCGFTTPTNAAINLTGLTVGTTYFVSVDGDLNSVGAFTIVVNPTGTPPPPIQGQDCIQPNPVCNQTMTVADPGYQGIGAICDIPGSYCLSSAERGSVWYSFTTTAAGNITFNIIPNNWPGGTSTTGADYDFAIWKMGGTVSCSSILAGSSTPLRCNYNSLGVTGLNSTTVNTAPAGMTQFNSAYETQIACAAGETYYLLINNHSTSTDGFQITFGASSPILYTAPTSVSWTGGNGISTQWDLNNNWGACNFPTCSIDATVNPFVNQPVITGIKQVRNLTINPGASLTLSAGSTLEICGNFTNLGSIIADPTSTVVMLGTGVNQTMTGSFTGSNALGNFTVNKTNATFSVLTNDDVEMNGNFLTANATSIFNSNGKYIKVGGNFTNNNGNTSFMNTGTTGTLEFDGTAGQTYNQGSSQLDLNNVVMNHTGTNVILGSNMFIKSATGTLTLTLGRIQTNGNRVDVANTANACVSVGNNNSYVFGNLYRSLNGAAGAYDFPLGTATLYERANINFTTATTIPRLQSRFDVWGTPALHTNGMSECATTYNLADENMGFWTINASANPTSGTYNTTLYCNGATNIGGNAWTVEKSSDNGATWVLSGTCDPTSTSAIVKRNGMNGFSIFAAAQATAPMPVELMGVYGFSVGRTNEIHWKTASEANSDHFEIEASQDGESFHVIGAIAAAGNSITELNYQFTDNNPYFPITYYRIRSIDLDASYKYSPIIYVESDLEADLTIHQVYPNPATETAVIEFSSKNLETFEVQVTASNGTTAFRYKTTGKGVQALPLNVKNWSAGVYNIRISTETGKVVQTRFVKE